MNIVQRYHSELSKYKNKHAGEVCYIFGCGPSINNFKEPEKGTYIGCNRIYFNKKIKDKLKYYFFGHKYINNQINEDGSNNKEEVDKLDYNIEKFCIVSFNDKWHHTYGYNDNDILKLKNINAIPIDITPDTIHADISKFQFINHSIPFPATQFALYAGFTKIYLVGCDCANFDGENHQEFFYTNIVKPTIIDNDLIEWWERIKIFKNINYPNAKLININPIGLKNKMDEDIYI
jgi:hypothetical protein